MNLKSAIKQIAFLSGPIIVGHVGQTLIGAGDVYIASMHSTKTVAAIGVANGIFTPVLLFGIGLMMGVSSLLSIKRGEGIDVSGKLASVMFYSTIVGVFITLLMLLINKLVPHFGLDPELVPSVQLYISIIAWSAIPSIIFQGLKEYMQSFEKVMAPNIISLIGVVVNIAVNYLLVFGYGGFKGYGEVGIPIASIFIRLFLFAALLSLLLVKEQWGKISHSLNFEIFRFSLPIAIAFFFEVMAFALMGVLSGKLGVAEAAANNIILTAGSAFFMIPLALAGAASVKVGHAFGNRNRNNMITFIKAVFIMSIAYSAISSTILAVFPEWLMGIFTQDTHVITLGIGACYIAAIFQLVDCTQVTASGVLRGLKVTRMPSVMVIIAFWMIGVPFGVYLAFFKDYSIQGLWIGLAVGLGVVSIGLGLLLKRRIAELT